MKKHSKTIVLALVMCAGMACAFGMSKKVKEPKDGCLDALWNKLNWYNFSDEEEQRLAGKVTRPNIGCFEALYIVWNWNNFDDKDE